MGDEGCFGKRRLFKIVVLSVLIGILASLSMVLFVVSIRFFSNVMFYGRAYFSCSYIDRYISPLGGFVILVPAIGGIVVVFLAKMYLKKNDGYGVPAVILAVIRRGGRMSPSVALLKTFMSAFCIGTGGSVGRVGPIVYVGASLGSVMGKRFSLTPGERVLLLGCGAASSIAVVFNAPITGVAFAAELILPELSNRIFIPLVVSATIADYIGRYFLGAAPLVVVPHYHVYYGWQFLLYALLGLSSGFIAVLFTKSLIFFENLFGVIKRYDYLRVVLGGLLVGVIGYVVFVLTGRYYIYDVGTNIIDDILSGRSFTMQMLILLLFGKIVATSAMLGSGGAGGIFAPLLFIGTVFGGIFGTFVHYFIPHSEFSPAVCGLIGMVSTLGGATNLVITSVIMSFEITREYSIILPIMLAVVLSRMIVNKYGSGGVYSYKLIRRGIIPLEMKEFNVLHIIKVSEIMRQKFDVVKGDARVFSARSRFLKERLLRLPVIDDEKRFVGVLNFFDIVFAKGNESVSRYVVPAVPTVSEEDTLSSVMERMAENKIGMAAVVDNQGRLKGIVTDGMIRASYFRKRKHLFL